MLDFMFEFDHVCDCGWSVKCMYIYLTLDAFCYAVLKASFRGRPLVGKKLSLPSDYVGKSCWQIKPFATPH